MAVRHAHGDPDSALVAEGEILLGPTGGLQFPDFYRFLPIFLTFLGDFNLQKLPSRRLQTLWEWKNRVLLEEYYVFNVAIPLEVE